MRLTFCGYVFSFIMNFAAQNEFVLYTVEQHTIIHIHSRAAHYHIST